MDLTPEEIYILIGLVIERDNVDIEGLKKIEIQKLNYRKIQRGYIKKRKEKFNITSHPSQSI